jgi:hypothetical protein
MEIYLVHHGEAKSESKDSQRPLTRESETEAKKVNHYFVLFLLAFFISTTACSVPKENKPTVIIVSPPSGSEFREGEEVAVQSTSTDAVGVVRVELVIDNVIIHTDPVPSAQSQVTFTQSWQATQGTHIILVRAYNAAGNVSSPVAVSVTVAQAATPTATLSTPTSVPLAASPTMTATACADNAVFVSDVTVPDGTILAPGQTFNKIWRVRNTGCPWGAGYQLVFVSGEAMSTAQVIPVPDTPQGGTADLLVALTAPTVPGTHSGTWRLRNPSGKLFGTIVFVKITVPGTPSPTNTSAPTPCSGTPNISSFTASQRIIPVFGSTILSWGPVTNADSVEIDQGIGEVGTPGSITVAPTTTTIYTLTAHCGSETATAQVRILLPFAITGSVTSVDPTDASGSCPKTINFSGTITVNDAGTVTYKWESSDGSNDSSISSLTFEGAGSKTVNHTWTLGTSGKTYTDYWEHLHILSPTDVTSNNATFTLRCD